MAYTAGNLQKTGGSSPGRSVYRYDTTDNLDDVTAAGYFNNKDDTLNLQKGDVIFLFTWTAVDTGTLSEAKPVVVTNVISQDAATSAGNVNVAEIWVTTSISSLN